MRRLILITAFGLALMFGLAQGPAGADLPTRDDASATTVRVAPGTEAGSWLLQTMPAETCSVTRAQSGCEGPSSLVSAQEGPADNCCARHFETCNLIICQCGVREFYCGPKSTGGCQSYCGCSICPV